VKGWEMMYQAIELQNRAAILIYDKVEFKAKINVLVKINLLNEKKPDVVAHACNPSTWEVEYHKFETITMCNGLYIVLH
jgi:hypothetical protein